MGEKIITQQMIRCHKVEHQRQIEAFHHIECITVQGIFSTFEITIISRCVYSVFSFKDWQSSVNRNKDMNPRAFEKIHTSITINYNLYIIL